VFFVACATPLFALARASLWGRGCCPQNKIATKGRGFLLGKLAKFYFGSPKPSLAFGVSAGRLNPPSAAPNMPNICIYSFTIMYYIWYISVCLNKKKI
jgi:hypothetical protein